MLWRGEGEFHDPVASAFRVKLVRNDVLGDCRFRGLSGEREGGGGEGSRRQVNHSGVFTLFVGAFCHFVFRSGLCYLCLSIRLFSGPPGRCGDDPETGYSCRPRRHKPTGKIGHPTPCRASPMCWGALTVPTLEFRRCLIDMKTITSMARLSTPSTCR